MSSQSNAVAIAQAHNIIENAFQRFKNTTDPEDARQISTTTVDDVRASLITIQKDLQRRRENRNLRKLNDLLEGFRRYGQAIDTLSNGFSPFMPWAWAPVRLMLQVSTLLNSYVVLPSNSLMLSSGSLSDGIA